MRQKKEKIKESIPFKIAPKTIRYPGINLTKEAKNLYSENYRTLMKETEKDIKKWKNVPYSCLCYLEQSIHSMQSLSKYHQLFHRAGPNNPKSCMEPEKILNSSRYVEKENQSG